MTYENLLVTPNADPAVGRFLEALARRDFDALGSWLAPDVWFRALLPKSVHESNSRRESVEAFRSWFGGAGGFQPLVAEQFPMAGREYLRYRFRILPSWAPEEWHVIEQAGFCRVEEGRIRRLDVVCSGFHSTGEMALARPRRALSATG